jgi:putative solute:sodium symporter small subunit
MKALIYCVITLAVGMLLAALYVADRLLHFDWEFLLACIGSATVVVVLMFVRGLILAMMKDAFGKEDEQ